MFFLSFFVVVALGTVGAALVLRRDSSAAASPMGTPRTRPVLATNRTNRTIAAAAIAVLAATIGYLTIAGPSGAATRDAAGPTVASSGSTDPSDVPSVGVSGSIVPVSGSVSAPVSASIASTDPVSGSVSAPVSGSGSIGGESLSTDPSADPSVSGSSGIEGVSASASNSSGVDAVSATKPADGTGGLAATGVDVLGGAGAGAVAVLLGSVILWAARRKGRHAL